MGEEEWMEVAEYLGNGKEIINGVQKLQERVDVVLHGYRTKRHNAWLDLQAHREKIIAYDDLSKGARGLSTATSVYLNEITQAFVDEYGTYDASQ
jgi:hypothetical protein